MGNLETVYKINNFVRLHNTVNHKIIIQVGSAQALGQNVAD